MKNLIYLMFLTLSLCLSSTAQAGTTNGKVNVLFIQSAQSGKFIPMEGKPGYYQLELTGVNPYIQFFTDRPNRKTGLYPTTQFLARWQEGKGKQSFNLVPPNAALSAMENKILRPKMILASVELSHPMYDSDTQRLIYIAHALHGTNTVPAGKLKNISLFIDDYCASCAGGHW